MIWDVEILGTFHDASHQIVHCSAKHSSASTPVDSAAVPISPRRTRRNGYHGLCVYSRLFRIHLKTQGALERITRLSRCIECSEILWTGLTWIAHVFGGLRDFVREANERVSQ